MASTTASFATTMGTVPVGPVFVRTRTPDTTALATITVSVRVSFVATVISLYLLCASVKAIHLYKSVPCVSVCLQTTRPLPQPPPPLPQVREPHTQTVPYNSTHCVHTSLPVQGHYIV